MGCCARILHPRELYIAHFSESPLPDPPHHAGMAAGDRTGSLRRTQRYAVNGQVAAQMAGRSSASGSAAEEVFVQGVPEPFVVDGDGCLDLSSMQIDPKVTILNGKRALVDANGRTKRPLAELRFLLGDQTLGSLQRPFKVAKGLPLQSFNPIEPPTAFASGRGTFSLLYPVYSLAEKSEPKDIPSSSLPASRPPIQTPALATAASGGAPQPAASGITPNGDGRSMPMTQLIPPPVPGSVPPLDQLVHAGLNAGAASMEHPLLLQHMQQKQHIWKAAREERKQQLDAKNSSRSLLMLKNPPDTNRRQKVTNRGGAGVPAHCSTCGKPRKGTHAKTGCPTHCIKCKKLNAECECPDGEPSNADALDSDTASQGD